MNLVVNITTIRKDGRIQGAVCSFLEMRDFELAAQKLESYETLNKQFNAVFKSSSDGIWVVTEHGL